MAMSCSSPKRLGGALLGVAACSLLGLPPSGSLAAECCLAPGTREGTGSAVQQEIIRYTNRERARRGLPPRRENGWLNSAARGHALNMARQSRLSHVLDGLEPRDRLLFTGYDWRACAENIARNQH